MSLAEPPVTPSSSAARLSPAAAYVAVVERVEKTRRRVAFSAAATRLVSHGAVLLAAFATLAVLDWLSESSTLLRGLMLVFGLLPFAVVTLIGAWQEWRKHSLASAAVDIEHEVDQFGQGLRTALDYQEAADRDFANRPAAASSGLLNALHHETYEVSERVRWNEVAPARSLWISILAFLLLAGTCLLGLAMVPELRIAAGRMLLLPWHYTQVTFEPLQTTVKQGESVVITATITGRPLAAAKLRYSPQHRPEGWTSVELFAPDYPYAEGLHEQLPLRQGKVQAKLSDLREDVVFEVLAGPVQLPTGSIRVLQPLAIKSFQATVTPPAYTKKPEAIVATYDFKVWEGSEVELHFGLNRMPASASLKKIAGSNGKPVTEELANLFDLADSNDSLRIVLGNVRESGTYELIATAADGMTLPPQRLKIQVTLDRKPSVKWVQPAEQWEVTPTTEVGMAIAAEDDLGVHRAGIAVQVGNGELETLWETDAAGEPSLAAAAALLLEDRGLTHKDSVTYHAFVEDNYFDQPRRTTTPLRFIDIRPYQQNFQLVDGGGCCNGNSVTLEELIKRQREQLTQSFAAQDQSLSKTALLKLASAQTELQDQTIEFAKGLAERGMAVMPLEEAERQMGSAVLAFQAGDVPSAVPAQQQALTYLIMARENLRKKLSNSSSSAQCRKFDREQKQKLRLPEQKKRDQQQQLAQNKKQLEDLAKRERQWSQQASQACQNPSSAAGKPSESQPSKEEVAKAQEQLLQELKELQEQIAKNELAGKTAQEQAARAKEAMELGQKELEQNQGDAASKQGETAADRLEQLAAHLAAMQQKDVGQRLDQAQKHAAQLAAKQETLAGEVGGERKEEGRSEQAERKADLAGKQRDLAHQAKMLAEVLEKLRQDAKSEQGPAASSLEQITAEQQPGEIAAGMQQTADALKQGNKEGGKAGAEQASDKLSQLAKALGAAKGELTQPQLQELIKLEEQLAQLRDAKKGEGDKPGQRTKPGQAGAAEKWEQLQDRLQQLAESDQRLQEAFRKLGGNQPLKPGDKLRPGESQPDSKPTEMPQGHYSWDQLGDYKGLDEIAKALQAKIQEAILAGALQDADEPVPPQYKGLVEQYYRTLSDDLR